MALLQAPTKGVLVPITTSLQKRQEWEQKILQQKASGLPIVTWCEREKVSYHTFNYWREKLGHVPPLHRSSFKELSHISTESGVTIEKKGMRIHVAKNFDTSTLAQCLKALDQLC